MPHNPEVEGSNPSPATIRNPVATMVTGFSFYFQMEAHMGVWRTFGAQRYPLAFFCAGLSITSARHSLACSSACRMMWE